ncbi:MAG: CBS domain-containing protein [Clostridiales bacterium]|jgi:CBS domain-containing protein|nr:CBS domain-containing protein [Clostridiales bacterium]
MNIAYYIQTKSEVAFLYEDFTFRQGLEKMRYHGYTAIPVLSTDNKYIGTISEGDFLWYLIDDSNEEIQKITMKSIEEMKIKDILTDDKNPPVKITSTIEELLTRAMDQNFIPVIDDRDYFIGIITRRDIIKHFLNKKESI